MSLKKKCIQCLHNYLGRIIVNYYIELIKIHNLSVRQLRNKIKSNEYERLPEDTRNKIVSNKKSNIIDFVKNPIMIKNSN